jgi:hypothetical protein
MKLMVASSMVNTDGLGKCKPSDHFSVKIEKYYILAEHKD